MSSVTGRGGRGPYRASEATLARRADARERLIAAATDIITADGYTALTVAATAARAGLSVGSVYRHFQSKGDLAAEVFRREADIELTAARFAADLAVEPLSALEDAIATFASRALASPRLAWALLAEPVGAEVEAERLLFRRSYRELFTALIERAIAAGQLPADQRPDLTAAAVVGAVAEALVGPLAPVTAPAPPTTPPTAPAAAPAASPSSGDVVEHITRLVVRLCGGQL